MLPTKPIRSRIAFKPIPPKSFGQSPRHTANTLPALPERNPSRSDPPGEAIESVLEGDLDIFATGFAAGDHALRLLVGSNIEVQGYVARQARSALARSHRIAKHFLVITVSPLEHGLVELLLLIFATAGAILGLLMVLQSIYTLFKKAQ